MRGCDESCQAAACPGTDGDFPATLSTFSLDAFEVTVGRFRKFVNAYPTSKPGPGDGKNPRNPEDSGWDSAWDVHLPDSEEAMRAALMSTERCFDPRTWTEFPGVNEFYPMNCVTWYEAMAFCAWDGGRLPTRAEWNYAAAGGEEQRVYPWSREATIDSTHAIFETEAGPSVVGTRPNGRGKWLQYDLAGNVAEWI